MVADFFTKSLQGKLFKKFICQIMNIDLDDPILRPAHDHRSVLEKETKPSLNKMEIGQTVGRDKTEIGQTMGRNKLDTNRPDRPPANLSRYRIITRMIKQIKIMYAYMPIQYEQEERFKDPRKI